MIETIENYNCGIYKINNIITKEFYIGSAKNFHNRLMKHFWELSKNIHCNTHLQRAWNKYGRNTFEFIIVEECEYSIKLEREQYYLDLLKPVYNISKTARGGSGKVSEKSKKKISDARKKYWSNLTDEERKNKILYLGSLQRGKTPDKETLEKRGRGIRKAKCVPVMQYELDGTFVQEHESINDAYLSCGVIYSRQVNACLYGKKDSAYECIWKFKNDIRTCQ